MDGYLFYKSACSIVGEDNAKLYAKKFGDLNDVFFNDLKNYEGLAFYIYSTSMGWHEVINSSLWSGNANDDILIFRDVLNAALGKLPKMSAVFSRVYRGYKTDDINHFLKEYTPGRILNFPGFTSASFHELGAFGGNILFIIRALNACSIWHLSANYHEGEALIPAGAIFRVEHIENRIDKTAIILQELDGHEV